LKRLIVVAAIVVAAASLAALVAKGTHSSTSTSRAARQSTSGCPAALFSRRSSPAVIQAISAALVREVPVVYREKKSQGRVAWRNYEVALLAPLFPTWEPEPRLIKRYANAAKSRCGASVAEASWVALLSFPECQIPCSQSVAFLARTRSGWHIWWHIDRSPNGLSLIPERWTRPPPLAASAMILAASLV
jgi:hypothetical protein